MQVMLGQIPAPPATARGAGDLLRAAIPGTDGDGGTDWRKGVVQWPESAAGWRVVQDCSDVEQDYGLGVSGDAVAAHPFLIQTVVDCPRAPIPQMAERARRRIEAISSQAVARELWTGAATLGDPWQLPPGVTWALSNPAPATGSWANPYLTAGTLLNADAVSASGPLPTATAALGQVEAAVADRTVGGPIYLHVPLDVLFELAIGLEKRGDLLVTPAGSIVVADGGYPGTSSDTAGSPLAIYGTGPVQVWLGDPRVYDDPSQVVNHRDNRARVFAERPAMTLFDPQTLVGAAVSPEG